MSGENRTEKPTPKRRGEARKRGQVAKSPEINSAAVLVATVASLVLFGPYLMRKLEEIVRVGLEQAGDPRLASEAGLAGLHDVGSALGRGRRRAGRGRRARGGSAGERRAGEAAVLAAGAEAEVLQAQSDAGAQADG